MPDEPVCFDATVAKVQTLADFGLRLTLDLPETAIVAAAQLMTLKRLGVVLHITISTVVTNDDRPKPTKPRY
jgi:hypothetical protein